MDARALARLRSAGRGRPALAAFLGVFAAALLGFLAIGAVLPVLPRYVTGPVGAGDLAVGVVMGAFAFSAVLSRPVGGRLADRGGRRPVVVAGLVVAGVAGLLLFLPLGVPGLVAARLVLGLGDGWVFTAGVTWAVDLAPEGRRAQAIGMFGLAIWGGLTFGALLGEAALALASYEVVWALAAGLPLLGALVARRVPERHVAAPGHAGAPAALWRVPRQALLPGVALAAANVGYGTMAGFVVLHLADAGVGHGAAVFTAFAGSVVATRLVGGRLPDVLGPARTSAGAFAAEAAGLGLVAAAQSVPMAVAGAMLTGLGFSLLFPSLALIVVRRTDDARRGAALGTFTAFFDVGVGLGAPLAGAVASVADYPQAFWTAAAFAVAGGVVAVVAARGGDADGPAAAAATPG